MTIAAPSAAGALPTYDASALQSVVIQLQSIVEQLQQLTAQLVPAGSAAAAQAGAATLGGGPGTSGSSCSGGANAVAGADTVAQGANATSNFDVTQAYPSSDVTQSSIQSDTRKKSRGSRKTRTGPAGQMAPTEFKLPRKNPRSVEATLEWARKQEKNPSQSWSRKCLAFVASAYGWSGSNVTYAIDHWDTAKDSMKHPGDRNPPAGALVYWKTGSRAGHVALSMGNGMVASNDIRRAGKIDIVPLKEIDRKWGANYVGWTDPYFPKAA